MSDNSGTDNSEMNKSPSAKKLNVSFALTQVSLDKVSYEVTKPPLYQDLQAGRSRWQNYRRRPLVTGKDLYAQKGPSG